MPRKKPAPVHTGAPAFDTRILTRNKRHRGRIERSRMGTFRAAASESKVAKWLRDE